MKLCWLESCPILQSYLLIGHLVEHLALKSDKVGLLDLLSEHVQVLEGISVEEEDSFSDEVLTLILLPIPDLLFDVPGRVLCLHDVSIGC